MEKRSKEESDNKMKTSSCRKIKTGSGKREAEFRHSRVAINVC